MFIDHKAYPANSRFGRVEQIMSFGFEIEFHASEPRRRLGSWRSINMPHLDGVRNQIAPSTKHQAQSSYDRLCSL
jgi:hypothetical protein